MPLSRPGLKKHLKTGSSEGGEHRVFAGGENINEAEP